MAAACGGCGREAGPEAVSHRHNLICPGCLTILFNLGYVKSECPQRHRFTKDNILVQPSGYWKCATCHRDLMRDKQRKESAARYAPKEI